MASIHQHETNPEFRVQGASLGLTDYSNSAEALSFPLNSNGGTECLCESPSLVSGSGGTGFQLSLHFPKVLGGRMLCRECGIHQPGKRQLVSIAFHLTWRVPAETWNFDKNGLFVPSPKK